MMVVLIVGLCLILVVLGAWLVVYRLDGLLWLLVWFVCLMLD